VEWEAFYEKYRRTVPYCAHKYSEIQRHKKLEFEDILQQGYLSLFIVFKKITDADGFNKYTDQQILSYVCKYVSGLIMKYLDSYNFVKMPVKYPGQRNMYKKKYPELSFKELAEKINKTEDEVQAIMVGVVTLQNEFQISGDFQVNEDTLLRSDYVPSSIVQFDDTGVFVDEFIDTLKPKEQEAVRMLLKGKSQADIARHWGTTDTYAWHIVKVLKEKYTKYQEAVLT
jgi:RNA polymerase sigma factor (sigma-70 family)